MGGVQAHQLDLCAGIKRCTSLRSAYPYHVLELLSSKDSEEERRLWKTVQILLKTASLFQLSQNDLALS